MRLRFLAAAGPATSLDRLADKLALPAAPPLEAILQGPRLRVWTVPGTPWLAGRDRRSVAVGLLFDRDGNRCDHLPDPHVSESDFTRQVWGTYALLCADRGGSHRVLRDPSGGIPVYRRRGEGVDLYASDAELLGAAVPLEAGLDEAFLRQWLTFPFLRARLTGLRDVSELPPGSAWRVAGDEVRETVGWSPWDHAAPSETIGDIGAAAAAVRGAILKAVRCLAGEAGDRVVHLSGGLDSSIVAAALAAAGRPFRGVTFATRAPDGDERVYARRVARHCGAGLAELVEDPAAPEFAPMRDLALRPPPNALLRPLHRALASHVTLTHADLVLDGAGGDNVFCYLASASPALDALNRRGIAAGFRGLHDLARLHDTTLWAAARAAWRRSHRPRVRWQRDESFLAAGVGAAAPQDHPWLVDPRAVDRGAFEQVQSIVGIHHFLADPAPGDPGRLHPLLAQPVLEACLRVPSWLWINDGRDRAVARAAFRDLLPDAIVARRSKGRLESMFLTGYMAGRRRLEAFLLDGRLATAGLLDRPRVEDYLRREGQPGDAGYIRLLELSSAESWLRAFVT